MFKLDEKLSRIHKGKYKRSDFIIADAKDPDMGPSLAGCGPKREKDGTSIRNVTRAEFLDNIAAIVKQDIVDIMLTSISNLEVLVEKGVFKKSKVKPAIRANDTTDVWVGRGGTYSTFPSRPFRSASLSHTKPFTNLGLYSMTFNNNLESDYESLVHFAEFREDAAKNKFKYFLEVFNPNVDSKMDPAIVPHYVNDCIVRCLAGLTKAERPQFLKIPFNGPKALDELASFDPTIVVGVLGGGAGTTRDCFELINQAEKYGARVALFGRKINLAEDPLAMVSFMREVASGNVKPLDAVKAYHASLQKSGRKSARSLAADSEITEKVLMSG
jgi:hypothetical protein